MVVARLIQRLRDTGIELHKLKDAVQKLILDPLWAEFPEDPVAKIRWLISDGTDVFVRNQDGFLDELSKGQRAFAFVVNLDRMTEEVKRQVPRKKRKNWSIDNGVLELEPLPKRKKAR